MASKLLVTLLSIVCVSDSTTLRTSSFYLTPSSLDQTLTESCGGNGRTQLVIIPKNRQNTKEEALQPP
jgi:hypothetical protein